MPDSSLVMEQSGGRWSDSFLKGFWEMMPLTIGAAPFGLMVGALGASAGLDQWDMIAMSGLVYAGASQFTALGIWETPVPVLTIIGVTLLVNLRHVLMGAALAPHIRQLPAWCRWSFLYVMSDESWATAIKRAAKAPLVSAYVVGVILPFYLSWILFSALGVSFGHLVEDPAVYGFDFVFTAVFTTLVMGFWKGRSSAAPILAAMLTALAAHSYLPGVWYIFLGGVAGVVSGALTYKEDRTDG